MNSTTESTVRLEPQAGYQRDFIMSTADIVIGGGAAGSGKTFSLLLDIAKYAGMCDNFGAVVFRRTYPEITQIGGLWEESKKIYPYIGARPVEGKVTWHFPKGRVSFSHMQHEGDLLKFQGAQIPYIGFDEVTHFSKQMFFYLLTRNRGAVGVSPKVRATCNPDPDSWVAEFIKWWIDQETGFPIPERAGKVRYFVMDDDVYLWGDTKKDVYRKAYHMFNRPGMQYINPNDLIKSATFLPGSIYENQKLLSGNPQYLANLMSQDADTRLRLLEGNWKIRVDGMNLFDVFKLRDMFTSEVYDNSQDKYITIDHARFGKDLAVIITWQGWKIIRIDIMYKSDTNDIVKLIRHIRSEARGVPSSNIIIDQDGIGVKDTIGCRIFQSNSRPHEVSRVKAFVHDLRTQVYFEVAEKVNESKVSVNMNNIWVHEDGRMIRTKRIKIKNEWYEVSKLITDDLRTIKREMFALDKPARITAKETQKELLGRSPDFGDAIAMRGEFAFVRKPAMMQKV